jgi:hypothetical protein
MTLSPAATGHDVLADGGPAVIDLIAAWLEAKSLA